MTEDLPLDNPFWQHSLRVWKNAKLQSRLLDLQNDHDYRINHLLFALWLASEKCILRPLHASDKTQSDTWHEHVITPLRQLRQSLPKEPAQIAHLRKQIQQCELQAEQIEHALLYKSVQEQGLNKQNDRTIVDCLILNLRASGLKESELSLVILAYMPTFNSTELAAKLAKQEDH